MAVVMMAAINASIRDDGERKYIIKNVVIKNARLPSRDLLNNRVLPYLRPIMAAAESDKLMVRSAIMAIFSLNKYTVVPAPINTQDAPDNPAYS